MALLEALQLSGFAGEASIAEIGAALGDTGRVRMLTALLGNEALTAGELAHEARVTPQTASGHLTRLIETGLLACLRQGRYRYYRLASPAVAELLETMMVAAAGAAKPRSRPRSDKDAALVRARTCYDHLAGRLGVAIAEQMVTGRHVEWNGDGGVVTASGARLLADLGLDLETLARRRRVFCRPCLDWSERRFHIGGAVGAGLAERLAALGWTKRSPNSRAIVVTAAGEKGLAETFGVEPASLDHPPTAVSQPAA